LVRAAEPQPIVLWPDMKVETTAGSDAIRERGTTTRPNRLLVDVRHAMLIPLPADARKASGAAVVICCGGGYAGEAIDKEGYEVARWLNGIGVTVFILEYRLPKPEITKTGAPLPLIDAQRAIRYVRAHSADWSLQPNHIGIMGFSAGGHLASTAITHFEPGATDGADPIERETSRPDFAILGYPVISMQDSLAHRGSRKNLLGTMPDPAMMEAYSNELHVTAQTPPTFIFLAKDDKTVPPVNSEQFYAALQKAGVPAELHEYQKGGHGFGVGEGECAAWKVSCASWLIDLKIIPQFRE
jgi:acetyl esterase/lipase